MENGGNDGDVAIYLEIGLQQKVVADLIVHQEEQAKNQPENDRHPQVSDRGGIGRVRGELPDGIIDCKYKNDDDKTDLYDPGEPILDFISENHNPTGCKMLRAQGPGLGARQWGLSFVDH
jgi:hypothetical protein